MLGFRPQEMILLVPMIVVLYAFVTGRLVAKTGHSGWLGVLFLIPVVNIGLVLYLAFAEWPIQRELNRLRAQTGSGPS